jgi:3-hydroxybutyryl-CoA dehydrogenase
MGNGIAHTFAQSGFTVKLIDVSEKSLDRNGNNCRQFR